MSDAFYGRTLAMLSATYIEFIQSGFEPLPSDFIEVNINDISVIENFSNSYAVAMIIEPVQGEEIFVLLALNNWLSIFDEIQTGAYLESGETSNLFTPGGYGSTLGGKLLACRAAYTVLDVVEKDKLKDKEKLLGYIIIKSFHKILMPLTGEVYV